MGRNFGVSALAKETGYDTSYVSYLMNRGETPAAIRDRSRRGTPGVNPAGRRVPGNNRLMGGVGISVPAVSVAPVPTSTGGYVPPRGRRIGGVADIPAALESSAKPGRSVKAAPTHRRIEPPIQTDAEPETLVSAQRRKEIATANQRELDYRQKVGELVPRYQMEQWLAGSILAAKDILLKIGPELRDKLAAETDPNRVEVMIVTDVERALRELESMQVRIAEEAREPVGVGGSYTEETD